MKKLSKGGWLIVLGVVLVVIDQVIKIAVKTHFMIGEQIRVFEWFRILFIENEGMAFGMKFGGWVGKMCLSIFRLGLFGVLTWWISKLLKKADTPTGVVVGLTLIAAGAMGNIIDCLFYGIAFSESTTAAVATFGGGGYAPFLFGKVVDMFYFPLFKIKNAAGQVVFSFFDPVFNFADSCVTVGAFYLILFHYKFFAKDDNKKEKK